MAGIEPGVPLTGEHALLRDIMTPDGMTRFESYLDRHRNMTEMQKRRVISALLDRFADDDAIEEELDMPGWTDQIVTELSGLYDEDAYRISRIPGTTLITS